MTEEIIEKNFDVGSAPKLIVKNIRGNIQVSVSKNNNIYIKAIKNLTNGDTDNTLINIEKASDGSIIAEAKYENNDFFKIRQPSQVEFIIEAPEDTSVHIDAISSSVEISGFKKLLRVKTISGKVNFSNCSGNLNLKTISGAIEGNSINGSLNLDTISGKINILEGSFTGIKSSSISGSVLVETQSIGEGPYKFNSISGKSIFIIPPETTCSLRASSISGKFKTDLISTDGLIRKNKWDLEFEGGGSEIVFKSISGGLRLLSSKNADG